MYILICLEGISYVGKTTVAKIVSNRMEAIYGPRVADGWKKKEKAIHKNPDHLARFSFFMKEIVARSEQIGQILNRTNVVLDRYLLSIFAYHNIITNKQLEIETDIRDVRQPDYTILLTTNELALKRRMKIRPPRHYYESDLTFLLNVQLEFLRLIDRDKTIIIDTSNQSAEEIAGIVTKELARRKLIRFQFPQRE